MRSIRRLAEELNGLGDSDTIKSFESFMAECCKVMDALSEGVKLDTLKTSRFSPAMRAGIARAIPDLEQAMLEAIESEGYLPLELTAQLIVIHRDPRARDLLTPTLLDLVEQVLDLARAGRLAVGAE
jgi:hypothetical protein